MSEETGASVCQNHRPLSESDLKRAPYRLAPLTTNPDPAPRIWCKRQPGSICILPVVSFPARYDLETRFAQFRDDAQR